MDLVKEIAKELAEYSEEVEELLEREKEETAKDAVSELKRSSPKRYGRYAKSWGVTKQGTRYIVHNKKHYRLTHLLENGHALPNGGRTQAQPHIAKVEQKVIARIQSNLEKRL